MMVLSEQCNADTTAVIRKRCSGRRKRGKTLARKPMDDRKSGI
jgi:hypothetical protein